MHHFLKSLAALFSPLGWVLIVVGSMLLSSRLSVPGDFMLNLPELVTVLQLAGGILILCGFGVITSQAFWPQVLVVEMMEEVRKGNTAAGLVLLGLKTFCGLAQVAFAIWLALTVTGLTGIHS